MIDNKQNSPVVSTGINTQIRKIPHGVQTMNARIYAASPVVTFSGSIEISSWTPQMYFTKGFYRGMWNKPVKGEVTSIALTNNFFAGTIIRLWARVQ